jgi:hypothetical protein
VAAFLMSVLLQLGIVSVTTGLLLCAATSAVGVILFLRAGRLLAVPVSTSATLAEPAIVPAPTSGPAGGPLPAIRPAQAAVRPTV